MASPHVDIFVLAEAPTTFSGAEKPLHFAENRERFRKWEGKIRHVVVEDMPARRPKRWAAEVHQRNSLLRGLEDANGDDVAMISDVDEVAHPEILITLREGCHRLTGLEMYSTFCFANWLLPPGPFARAARAVPVGMLKDPHRQRNHIEPERVLHDAGRHYTTLGDIGHMINKFETYSHDEMDNRRQKASGYLARAQKMGMDVFSRELVSVVPAAELCRTQRSLLRIRPDLFDFAELPPHRRREMFRWYANWRVRQPDSSRLVPALDDNYDERLLTIAVLALAELARHFTWTVPRRGARVVRQNLT